jgi:hypothetical protein
MLALANSRAAATESKYSFRDLNIRDGVWQPQKSRPYCATSRAVSTGGYWRRQTIYEEAGMGCHTLGKKAYRVTKKFELVTITSPLFDMDFLKVDFRVAGFAVTGMGLRQVGADMDMNKIETYVDPDQKPQGVTDTCGDPPGTIRVMFKSTNLAPFDMSAQALVIHEGVHVSLRRNKVPPGGHLEEAAAYLAQALFFERKGESIIEDWEEDNQWAFNQPHIDDPVQADSKARIYAAAEQVIEKFDMDVKPVSLTAVDVSDLLVAIAKDPGYAVPKRVKPRPPKPDHPATFLERWRARREKRRARWVH